MIRATLRAASVGVLGILLTNGSLEAQELARSAAVAHVDALRLQQCHVQDAVRAIPAAGPQRDAVLQELRNTKDHMYAELVALETLLITEPLLDRAVAAIRESRLGEKIQYSLGTIEQWDDGSENTLESIIQQDLGILRDKLLSAPNVLECPAPA